MASNAKRTDPTVHITNPAFQYTPAHATDIRATFRKYDPHWPFGQVNPAELRQLERRVKEDDLTSLGEALL